MVSWYRTERRLDHKKDNHNRTCGGSREKQKRRVAAYCRVSSGSDEQLVSLEAQKEHYENYITANPDWEYAGLYYDEGITGTKKEVRPALMSMIRDCENGKIDCIVTKSLSRFVRNTTDCLELVRKLLDLGISVYFEKEKLDTGSMESELLLSIITSPFAREKRSSFILNADCGSGKGSTDGKKTYTVRISH